MTVNKLYRGRFAPSPSGHLHYGSLIAATGSYLQAKSQSGKWLLRIDDIDPPREIKGATKHILKTLEEFGFEWDENIQYQSQNNKRYAEVVSDLLSKKLAYPCSCSRSSIIQQTKQNKGPIIYPGLCRNGPLKKSDNYTLRLCCINKTINFKDRIQGPLHFDMEKQAGDFILQRRDKIYSYHLATAIDDADQGITEVVRGKDLLNTTPNQILVQQTLQLNSPSYCHLPLVYNEAGKKLSKQNHALPIKPDDTVALLYKTLKFLGQLPPNNLITAKKNEVWLWAIKNWDINLVPK